MGATPKLIIFRWKPPEQALIGSYIRDKYAHSANSEVLGIQAFQSMVINGIGINQSMEVVSK